MSLVPSMKIEAGRMAIGRLIEKPVRHVRGRSDGSRSNLLITIGARHLLGEGKRRRFLTDADALEQDIKTIPDVKFMRVSASALP